MIQFTIDKKFLGTEKNLFVSDTMKWIDESLGKMKKNIEKSNYLTKAIEDFRKTKLEKD